MSGLNQSVCRYFSSTGTCFYGDQCNFIHSSTAGTLPKSQRPCRNISIHGFCKFEGKGCEFNHSISEDGSVLKGKVESEEGAKISPSLSSQPASMAPLNSKKQNGEEQGSLKSDIFTKSRLVSASDYIPPTTNIDLHATHSEPSIPYAHADESTPNRSSLEFNPDYHSAFPPLSTSSIPTLSTSRTSSSLSLSAKPLSGKGISSIPEFDPTLALVDVPALPAIPAEKPTTSSLAFPEFDPTSLPSPQLEPSKGGRISFPEFDPLRVGSMVPTPQPQPPRPVKAATPVLPTSSGSTSNPNFAYFYGQQIPVGIPYHTYLPHTSPLLNKESRRSIQSFFMAENFRQEFRRQSRSIRSHINPDDPLAKELPINSTRFHSFYPLETLEQKRNPPKVFTFSSFMYKCISSIDGHPYAIRRIDGLRIVHEAAILQITEIWRGIQHPNIVTLRDLFTGKDSNGCSAVFFVYDYHPCSETLEGKINQPPYFTENVLWSFISQLLSALRTIHNSGRACRIITPSKIIFTGKNRIRISGVGIYDIIHYDGGKNLLQHQHEDLASLGKLILCLACKSLNAVQTVQKSLEFIASHYSNDLKGILYDLLSKPHRVPLPSSIMEEIFAKYSLRFIREIEHLHNYTDVLEAELGKEVENGRLFRLVTKMGFINERPEFDLDPTWSETDNRYLLKLLRDYIFHQNHPDGSPSVDMAHVVDCLNKLDAGVEERVMLMSRDEQSVLIVSYKDLHNCVQSAFSELFNSSVEAVDRIVTKNVGGPGQ